MKILLNKKNIKKSENYFAYVSEHCASFGTKKMKGKKLVYLRPYGFIRKIPVSAVTEGRVVGLLALTDEHLLGLRGLEEEGELVDLVRRHAVCVVAEGLRFAPAATAPFIKFSLLDRHFERHLEGSNAGLILQLSLPQYSHKRIYRGFLRLMELYLPVRL